jgi:hypothetical protein
MRSSSGIIKICKKNLWNTLWIYNDVWLLDCEIHGTHHMCDVAAAVLKHHSHQTLCDRIKWRLVKAELPIVPKISPQEKFHQNWLGNKNFNGGELETQIKWVSSNNWCQGKDFRHHVSISLLPADKCNHRNYYTWGKMLNSRKRTLTQNQDKKIKSLLRNFAWLHSIFGLLRLEATQVRLYPSGLYMCSRGIVALT